MKSTNFIKKLREEDAITISETEGIKRLTAKNAIYGKQETIPLLEMVQLM